MQLVVKYSSSLSELNPALWPFDSKYVDSVWIAGLPVLLREAQAAELARHRRQPRGAADLGAVVSQHLIIIALALYLAVSRELSQRLPKYALGPPRCINFAVLDSKISLAEQSSFSGSSGALLTPSVTPLGAPGGPGSKAA